MLKRKFVIRNLGLWKYLYVSLVTPHLEYAVHASNPHLEGDIDKIEIVQRRATRIPFGFEKFEYEERLKIFSLTRSKNRRVRGEIIEMSKVMISRESINWEKPLDISKNLEISGPSASLQGNSLSMRSLLVQ